MATNNEPDYELERMIEEDREMIERIAESDLPIAKDCRRCLDRLE